MPEIRVSFWGLLVLTLASAATTPSFEVASIRKTDPGFQGTPVTVLPGGRFTTRGATLKFLIQFAWGLQPRLVSGGPSWVNEARFDITAQAEAAGPLTMDTIKPYVQALVKDRFHLSFHRDPKEFTVYALVADAKASRLKGADPDADHLPSVNFTFGASGPTIVGRIAPLQMLAGVLQTVVLDRPVIDSTNLAGNYTFELHWAPDADQFGGRGGTMATESGAPSLFAAMREQLGLRLESRKAKLESIVIDNAAEPDDN